MATTMAPTRSRAEVEAEIKGAFGFVPGFFDRMPDRLLGPEWEVMRELELGETLIPNKYKELIGVAVSAESRCRYCSFFHSEAAKLFGATDEEIEEAVHFARYAAGWSTYVNGIRYDYEQFVREVGQIGSYLSKRG